MTNRWGADFVARKKWPWHIRLRLLFRPMSVSVDVGGRSDISAAIFFKELNGRMYIFYCAFTAKPTDEKGRV